MLDMPDYHSVLYVNIADRNWKFEDGAFINVNKDNSGQKVYELTFNPRCVRDFDKNSGSTLDYIEFKKCVKNSLNEQSIGKEIESFKFKTSVQSLQVSKDSEKERSNEGVAGGR